MILTGSEILREVERNKITILPFNKNQLNPNSYNYRLSTHIAYPELNVENNSLSYKTIEIPKTGFMLEPGSSYLAHTHEMLGSEAYAMSLIGRSSLGRLGLFLQVSADLGHTKSCHRWTLEIVSCMKFIIYPLMIIGQISFWENYGEHFDSNIRYNKFNFLNPSLD